MATAITDGAALVRKLKESGTGDAKLAHARSALKAAHADGRRATADDVLAALEVGGVPELTLKKALAFAADGEYVSDSERYAPNIEDVLLAGDAPAFVGPVKADGTSDDTDLDAVAFVGPVTLPPAG